MPALGRRLPSPRRRAALTTALLVAAVAAGATACGPFEEEASGPFKGLTGPQIVNKSIGATKGAKSLTLDVATTSADGPLKAYMSIDRSGQCAGTLSVGVTGTAELIRSGGTAYMRFDEAFLREQGKGEPKEQQEAVLKMLKGKWVETDASDPEAKDSLELCDLNALLSEFEQGVNFADAGEETTVNGKKALRLTEGAGAESTTVYVATEGTPYLLKIVSKGGEEPGTITFSSYDKPVPARKPAAEDVVDLED
ncbi:MULTISPECIES: hypothetical protein [Streptomyces]|uniref:Lipoprotein n=1 Tax=Streptomyces solicathayae TaxID=3081768 RepID=A0ABZ0LXS3_9ACTN|nr:hypothetical protein [Streptomyces sp. HUAS YS2]WOX23961.1 hypothetical protein R2D22_22245 [Streptomyces sp. HUAS YS2]